uniref:Uncharacterized protein n=1 Tax=Hucho hucho TaxID=62062 RepID=A0A4W5QJN8_9TELE
MLVCRLCSLSKTINLVHVPNLSGQVLDNRTQPPWRLSFLTHLFWSIVEVIGLLFQTLVQPDLTKTDNTGSSSAGPSDDWLWQPKPPSKRESILNCDTVLET